MMLERAQKVTASDTWEVHPRFPFVMERASGAYVWDYDGKQYVDFTSCSGAAPLGVGHEYVLERTIDALRRTGGILPGPVSTLRVKLAERLCELFPAAERVLFFRTGSCATTAAVRLARVASGKRRVLTSGFHGWHDWHLQYRPHLAMPDRDQDTTDFGYHLGRLTQLLTQGDAAAVIITPEVNFFSEVYARELSEIVHSHGALLVIDEVMTGFRYRIGGYSDAAGLRPDIIAVSKGLANGTALSAVLGRDEILRSHEKTYLGNTFQREVTPFAAALATIEVYAADSPLDDIVGVGSLLMNRLDAIFAARNVHAWAFSEPSMFDLVFADLELGHRFCMEMWGLGFLMQYGGRFMPSAANSPQDVNDLIEAAGQALDTVDASRPEPRADNPPQTVLVAYAAEHFAADADAVRRWSLSTCKDDSE